MILSLDYLSAKSINSSPLPSLETQLHFMVENLVMYPAFAATSREFVASLHQPTLSRETIYLILIQTRVILRPLRAPCSSSV
jgi:hypothetical protein